MQTVWLNPPRCVIDSEARSSSRAVRSGADLAVATDRGCLAMAAGRFTSTCIGVGGAISRERNAGVTLELGMEMESGGGAQGSLWVMLS